jgi:hypothetical protein
VKPKPTPEPRVIGPFRFEAVRYTYDVRLPKGQTIGAFVKPELAERLAQRLLALPIDWSQAHSGSPAEPGYLTAEQLAMVVAVRDEANGWRY